MVFVVSLLSALEAAGQTTPACRVLCAPEFKVEPTVTFTNLFGSPRIVDEQGTTTREPRETEFEVILSLGLPTRASWLEFTVEAIFLPFDRESTPELEFETNLIWLSGRTHARLGQFPLRHRRQVQPRRDGRRSSGIHAQAEFRARHQSFGVQLAPGGSVVARR